MQRSELTAKRTRTSTPRTRSGCGICRKRHVKCDEARPSCLRCSRAGWTCDGYDADKAVAIASSSRRSAASVVPGSAISITSYAIPFKVPGSQKDRQILHYFCVQGAQEIASHFNVDFWTNIVLQQSHQQYVVRQALVSLSELHLICATTTSDEPCPKKNDALAQYGKAVHALRKRIERPDHDTMKAVLTCCILFYCFEAALGDSGAAMRHLDAGLDLLSAHRQSREIENDHHMGALSRVFESLDLQATIFDDSRVPRLRLLIEDDRDRKSFHDLNEAYGVFKRLQNSLFNFLTTQTEVKFFDERSLPEHVVEEKRFLREQLRVWLGRFEDTDFEESADKSEYLGARLLLIQWHVSNMLLESNYPINESVFGSSPNPRAETILDMVDELRHHSQGRQTSISQCNIGQRRTFSSESGVVGPLFALAAKCSDEAVCDRALGLLSSSQRREGLYDSGSMAEIIYQFRAARQQTKPKAFKHRTQSFPALSLETYFDQEIGGVIGITDGLADSLELGPSCYKNARAQGSRRSQGKEPDDQNTISEAVVEVGRGTDEASLPVLDRNIIHRDVGVPDFAQRYTQSTMNKVYS